MLDIEKKLLKEFNDLKDDLLKWGNIVDKKIVEILNTNKLEYEIKIFPKCRLKDDDKFISKALYRDKNYSNPILCIEDKVATRVVILKSDDIKLVSDVLIKFKGWQVKITRDLKDIIAKTPKEFDYQSMHLVVNPKLSDKRFKKQIIPLLTCEIQIRTLLQHAFAEVSHDSTYKGPFMNDVDIIRNLSKSMALMESTDDYFCRIFDMMTDDTRKFRNYINELTTIYIKYNRNYNKKNLDIDMTDIVFELLTKKNITIDKIKEFKIQNNSDLAAAIKNNTTHIFKQPIILLLAYYLYNHRNFLKKEWNLSSESLNDVFTGFGFSLNS